MFQIVLYIFGHKTTKNGLKNQISYMWLSGERDRLMTWWFRVQYPVEANFLSGVFSPLTFAEK